MRIFECIVYDRQYEEDITLLTTQVNELKEELKGIREDARAIFAEHPVTEVTYTFKIPWYTGYVESAIDQEYYLDEYILMFDCSNPLLKFEPQKVSIRIFKEPKYAGIDSISIDSMLICERGFESDVYDCTLALSLDELMNFLSNPNRYI